MKQTKISGIYKIENIVNHKIYIGSSFDVKNRIKSHFKWLISKKKGTNLRLLNAFNKHGVKNFKSKIIKVVYRNQYESFRNFNNRLRKIEQRYINKYKSFDSKFGYNISLDTRCCVLRGKNHYMYGNGYKVKGHKNGMYGRHHTEESKLLMRKTRISYKRLKGWTGGIIGTWEERYGKQKANRMKKELSKKLTGIKRSDKTKEKLRMANLGEKNPCYKKIKKNVINKVIGCYYNYSKCFQEISEKLKIDINDVKRILKRNKLIGFSRKKGEAIKCNKNGRFIFISKKLAKLICKLYNIEYLNLIDVSIVLKMIKIKLSVYKIKQILVNIRNNFVICRNRKYLYEIAKKYKK